MSRTFDPRVSKFFNRALPLPPTGEKIPEEGATEENVYEQVSPSQEERDKKRLIERDSYDDIEDDIVDDSGIYSSPWDLNHSIEMMGLSSKQRDEITKDLTVNGDTTSDEPMSTLPRSVSTDYLEPVSQADMDCVAAMTNGVVATAARSDWYPHPAVKCSREKPRKSQFSIAEPYVTMFADSGRILDKDRLAMNSREGFNKMCLCNLETLQLICEGMYIEFVNARTQFWKDARWRDFELVDDERPEYVTGPLAFYRARSSRVATTECLLMVGAQLITALLSSDMLFGFSLFGVGTSSFQSPRSPVLCFFYLYSCLSFVSFYNITPPQFQSSYLSVSTHVHVLITTSSSVFLSTWPITISVSPHLPLLLFLHS